MIYQTKLNRLNQDKFKNCELWQSVGQNWSFLSIPSFWDTMYIASFKLFQIDVMNAWLNHVYYKIEIWQVFVLLWPRL